MRTEQDAPTEREVALEAMTMLIDGLMKRGRVAAAAVVAKALRLLVESWR